MLIHSSRSIALPSYINRLITLNYIGYIFIFLLAPFAICSCVDRDESKLTDPPALITDMAGLQDLSQNTPDAEAMDQNVDMGGANTEILDRGETLVDANFDADASAIDMALILDMTAIQDADTQIQSDMDILVECGLNIDLESPTELSFHHQLNPTMINGLVTNQQMMPVEDVTVSLYDQFETLIFQTLTNDAGEFSLDPETLYQTPGQKVGSIGLMRDNQGCSERQSFNFYVCSELLNDDFSMLDDSWTLSRDASWDPRGWLEMTGIERNQVGAVYNDSESIQSGLASIEFTLITGGGIGGGADGFALTIVELDDPSTFSNLINAANRGGGLGYAIGGLHAEPDYMLEGEALTVEIDTWYNEQASGARHTDPTSQNHIAITLNGAPGDHIAWFEVPNIEDLQPHTVRVDFVENTMRITYDGLLVIDQDITFTFKGGYMFFSGSTGSATNYHRFDEVQIIHGCR